MSTRSKILYPKNGVPAMMSPSFIVTLERMFTTIPSSSAVVFRAFIGCAAVMAFLAVRLVRGSRHPHR